MFEVSQHTLAFDGAALLLRELGWKAKEEKKA